jgi:hypothetical protein
LRYCGSRNSATTKCSPLIKVMTGGFIHLSNAHAMTSSKNEMVKQDSIMEELQSHPQTFLL